MSKNPRISANKLAEYMSSTSFARKRAILQEHKFPQKVAMVRWTQAENPVTQFVTQGSTDLSIIENQIQKLQALNLDTEFKIQNRNLSVEALQKFQLLSNQLDLSKFNRHSGLSNKGARISINGVEVSVFPQVILEGVTKKGEKVVGGVKLSFPKSFPINAKSAEFLSTLIHWHCEVFLSNFGKPDLRLCYAVDIPTANVFKPPTTYKRRRQQLAEACKEIVQRWDKVDPPTGYDESH